ncbi:MAG: hypothetical protein KF774_09820 [Planctomyces sp.]|nr:hypothetical protein [Planctomyces sp.]
MNRTRISDDCRLRIGRIACFLLSALALGCGSAVPSPPVNPPPLATGVVERIELLVDNARVSDELTCAPGQPLQIVLSYDLTWERKTLAQGAVENRDICSMIVEVLEASGDDSERVVATAILPATHTARLGGTAEGTLTAPQALGRYELRASLCPRILPTPKTPAAYPVVRAVLIVARDAPVAPE